MKKPLFLSLAILLFTTAGSLFADQTFTDEASFLEFTPTADICLANDFTAFEGNDVVSNPPIEEPIVQPAGTFSFFNGPDVFPPFGPTVVDATGDTDEDVFFIAVSGSTIVFDFDTSIGQVAGFGFTYLSQVPIDFTIFDTDGNVVDSFVLDESIPDEVDSTEGFFGWVNCDNVDVGRIEFATPGFNFINPSSFCFNEIVEEEPTAQDCIEDVIASINDVFASASPQDQAFLTQAIYELEGSLDPTFWATEDRLSSYGTGFFDGVFVATYFLECVGEDALVEDILISIQDCLSLIVQNEIDFALDNPYVDNNLLAYSDFFESYADAYSDAGLYLEAVLLHFYAWLFAFWA